MLSSSVSLVARQPSFEVASDKIIVDQMRVGGADPVQFRPLAVTQGFGGVQAPGARQQALMAQHFVDAGDAAGKAVGDIEQCGVTVGDL